MRRRFVILLDPESAPRTVSDQVTDLVRSLGGSWWHRFPHIWLLTTKKSTVTAKALRDAIGEISSDLRVLVLRLPQGRSGWAAHGPTGLFKWITLFWNLGQEPDDTV